MKVWYFIFNSAMDAILLLRDNWKITGLAFLLILALSIGFCGKRNIQTENEQLKQQRAIEGQQRVDEAKTESNQATNTAQESVNKVKQIENANFANTSGKQADKARCLAFPESAGCK
jgi:uncharacterized protein HemX